MIDYITKNLVTVKEDEGIVFHGCNCVGGFGSGVAGAIRRKFPHVYEAFKQRGVGKHLLGRVDIIVKAGYPIIANGYTQLTCGHDGNRYADPVAVEKTLYVVANYISTGDLVDIYMPKIGCGLGGLSWEDEVLPIVEKVSLEFPDLNIHICDI